MTEIPDNLDRLEREVEQELACWSGRLDVLPVGGALHSVRAAVRIELDEPWLAAQPSPLLPAAVMERVRTAVAAELKRVRLRRWQASPTLGSLSAAAVLLLCAGIIWFAGTLAQRTSPDVLDRFVAAGPEALADPILSEVQSLEEDLCDQVAAGQDDNESLSDLVHEMDQMLDERAPAKKSSGDDGKRPEVLG